jgi:circadian clock protein KaiB
MTDKAVYRFRLYISGDTPNSAHALANLTVLCDKELRGRHEIEVVDVFREPGRALSESVLMTPTLLKLSPGPVQRIVGTLAGLQTVVLTLGLGPRAG